MKVTFCGTEFRNAMEVCSNAVAGKNEVREVLKRIHFDILADHKFIATGCDGYILVNYVGEYIEADNIGSFDIEPVKVPKAVSHVGVEITGERIEIALTGTQNQTILQEQKGEYIAWRKIGNAPSEEDYVITVDPKLMMAMCKAMKNETNMSLRIPKVNTQPITVVGSYNAEGLILPILYRKDPKEIYRRAPGLE